MFSKYNYHSLARKYVILFGHLFNNLSVRRHDKQGNLVSDIVVPISYSAKRHWVWLIHDDISRSVAAILPRLGFNITDMAYDVQRQLFPLNRISSKNPDVQGFAYEPVPYKITFELYAMTKNADDMFQIWEQIVPWFPNDIVFSVKLLPELARTYDIAIRFKTLQMQDVFEGEVTNANQKGYLWTFTFEMDAWFFGPIDSSGTGIIKDVIINLFDIEHTTIANRDPKQEPTVIINVTPGLTEDGKPTNKLSESIYWNDVEATDDYGFCIDIKEYLDNTN
jgi:hypothetical protein